MTVKEPGKRIYSESVGDVHICKEAVPLDKIKKRDMKLSDYNKLLKMRSLTPIELKSDEYFLVTDRQLLYKVEGNNEIQNIRFADQKLHLKGIDTNSFWYTMNNRKASDRRHERRYNI